MSKSEVISERINWPAVANISTRKMKRKYTPGYCRDVWAGQRISASLLVVMEKIIGRQSPARKDQP